MFSDGDPDERAREALKELSSQDALSVLSELKQTPNIEHVSNKSALLCSIIKTYRQKLRAGSDNFPFKRPGPDETKLKVCSDAFLLHFFLQYDICHNRFSNSRNI